jgi:hypothetical protein
MDLAQDKNQSQKSELIKYTVLGKKTLIFYN